LDNIISINKPIGGEYIPSAIWFEFIIINRVLSEDDRKIVENYLKDKWNI
jgi:hypothetical protein